MNKNHFVLSLLFVTNSMPFYASAPQTVAKKGISTIAKFFITGTAAGSATIIGYTINKSVKNNFDQDATQTALQHDLNNASTYLKTYKLSTMDAAAAFTKKAQDSYEACKQNTQKKYDNWKNSKK